MTAGAPEPRWLRRDVAPDWLTQFREWFTDACTSSGSRIEASAMVLCTVGHDGRPRGRTVTMKDVNDRGFFFSTSYDSPKADDIAHNSAVSLVFLWHPLHRQVVVHGIAKQASRDESDSHFDNSPDGKSLSLMASPQSQVISGPQVLEQARNELATLYAGGTLPRPSHLGSYCVAPEAVDFWQGRADMLHDRFRYRQAENDWIIERLAP